MSDDLAVMRDDPGNAKAAPEIVIEPIAGADRKRRAEIEAAIRGLPILPEEEWQVRHTVDELCLRAAIYAASQRNGRVPPPIRPATRQMMIKELEEFERRAFDLAEKIERGDGSKRARERLKRAREKLARLIGGLHGPTIEALDGVPVQGRAILGVKHRSPMKLEDPLVLRALARAARIEADKARAVPDKAENADQLEELFAMVRGLRRLEPDGPRYAGGVGRPPNRQVHAIADLITEAYALTGEETTFSQGKRLNQDAVRGPFIEFASTIFAIMGIRHDALRYVSVAAFARRGRGRKR